MATRLLRKPRAVVVVGLCMLLAPLAQARAQGAPAPGSTRPIDVADAAEGSDAAATVTGHLAEPESRPSSSHPPRTPAFQLRLAYDLPLLGVALVFAGSRLVLTQPAYCAPRCARSDLNALDRETAGFWSPAWQRTSDAGLYVLAGGTALLLFLDEGFLPGLNDGVVIVESALAAMATASIMTLAARRPRPFLYGEEAPLSQRNGADASLSFLSSHAASAFATATALFMTMRRLHPRSTLTRVVAGVGALLAGLVASARVLGGMHFITDAVGGAVIGTSMGVLIPALHESPVRMVPSASAGQRGLSFTALF